MKQNITPYIIPDFICRVAGLPENFVTELRSVKIQTAVNSIFEKEKEMEEVRIRLSELLYHDISLAHNSESKNLLLKLRRNVFNLREVNTENISGLLSTESKNLLTNLIKIKSDKEDIYNDYMKLYLNEIGRIRKEFKLKIQEEDFQKGLLLSSKSLFLSQKYYLDSTSNQSLNRKLEQIERGLLRYFTRMVMKATPFGTFCAIIPGQISYDQ